MHARGGLARFFGLGVTNYLLGYVCFCLGFFGFGGRRAGCTTCWDTTRCRGFGFGARCGSARLGFGLGGCRFGC